MKRKEAENFFGNSGILKEHLCKFSANSQPLFKNTSLVRNSTVIRAVKLHQGSFVGEADKLKIESCGHFHKDHKTMEVRTAFKCRIEV